MSDDRLASLRDRLQQRRAAHSDIIVDEIVVPSIQFVHSQTAPDWHHDAVCAGQHRLFFPAKGERPEAREVREERARRMCLRCPALVPCRQWARDNREYGYWGGENEEDRARAGFGPDMPTGVVARAARMWRDEEGNRQ